MDNKIGDKIVDFEPNKGDYFACGIIAGTLLIVGFYMGITLINLIINISQLSK